jgi:DNA processing protein
MSSVIKGDWSHWLALKSIRGVGNILGQNLVRAFGGPDGVFRARSDALRCAGVRPDIVRAIRTFDRWADVTAKISRLGEVGGRLVTWQDESYPEVLRHIYDPPLFLFVRGALEERDALAIAIVGSRASSPYGREMTAGISDGLARAGLTIVSGLARGIDAAAHAAALAAGGRTIAVLGCGIDLVYPSEHHQLQMRIVKNGAVVSEFPPGTPPDGENFPSRNRIISGLSLGTVVVEATEKSGSLITAEHALEQGREVFAVPGPVGARSRGPHQLIRQGATLVESADDVLREIHPHMSADPRHISRSASPPPLDGIEQRVFTSLEDAPVHVDDLMLRTGLAAARVLEVLLSLELRGLVQQLPGKRFSRLSSAGPGTSQA